MLYIHQPLVKYRRHGGNVSFFAERDDTCSFEHRERRLRWVDEKSVAAYENIIADIETLFKNGRINHVDCKRLKAEALRVRDYYAIERQMMDGCLLDRFATLARAVRHGNIHYSIRFLPRALPRPVYRAMWLLREKLRASLLQFSPK